MGMGMKSLKWEGIGTKNLFPHTVTAVLKERLPKESRLDGTCSSGVMCRDVTLCILALLSSLVCCSRFSACCLLR